MTTTNNTTPQQQLAQSMADKSLMWHYWNARDMIKRCEQGWCYWMLEIWNGWHDAVKAEADRRGLVTSIKVSK